MKFDFTPGPCCDNPSITAMDHFKGWFSKSEKMVNRYCGQCQTHWYGPVTNVETFSDSEWTAMMDQPLN